ncbi:DHH family phosphoesterase [Caldalkalibacillus salinus]|uniref:DHH family phosphoesterase n=1 Tax=Caldalkalibacillus salinus TaxID=2803787 RepID=UPI0019205221|nr:bifunctional oligoribonuclease/PAP phosphatase NrnA [Caldalkalibacillus salinus]
MRYDIQLEQAAHYIRSHDDFLVLAHLHPDGDAIGSTVAMGLLLHHLGKSVTIANEGETPSRFAFLSRYKPIEDLSVSKLNKTFQHVITVDVADESRMGNVQAYLAKETNILNIDHHPTNTMFGDVNLIQPRAASTTQILYDLIKEHFQDAFDHALATALYTGLLTDTGGFRHSNTTKEVFDMASHLLTFGVDPNEVAEQAIDTTSPSHLNVLKKALNSLTFANGKRVAIFTVTKEDMLETGATKDDIDGLVSYPKNIEGVEVGALLKEWSEGEVKVSLRSKRDIDVAVIAQENGGGGHAKAAGYTFNGSLEDAKTTLLDQLQDALGDDNGKTN